MKCPWCAEEIQDDAFKCRYCGDVVDPLRGEKLPVSRFLSSASKEPYRNLVQEHVRRESTNQLMQAGMAEASFLASLLDRDLPTVNEQLMTFIDSVNDSLGYDQVFWSSSTCAAAIARILPLGDKDFGLDGRLSTLEEASRPENQRVAFHVFQVATLSFAYSASTQRAQRKFMGIRKGLFG